MRRRATWVWIGGGALVALGWAVGWARPLVVLDTWELQTPGTVLGVDRADMNGDGLDDLVVAHMRDPEGTSRQVSVWVQGPAGPGRFKQAPEWTWDVPEDACAFSAGDFDAGAGGEVLFLAATRLVVVGEGGTQTFGPMEGFFDYPERGALPVWDLVRDLDGDGRLEVLAPTKEGYAVYGRAAEGALRLRGEVLVPPSTAFGFELETKLLNRFLSATSRLRRVVVCDLNGDARLDLAAYREGGLARFYQREDGSFPERPDEEVPLALIERAKESGEGGEGRSESFENVRLNLEDVDGDGEADLIATRTLGSVGLFESLRTQHVIFRGEGGRWNEDAPDVVVNLPGVSPDPQFVDFDGDGRRDLLVSAFRVDMFTNVKRALFESMTIEHFVFVQGDDPWFDEDEPSVVLDVEVSLESLERRDGVRAVELGADVDGDGLVDMVRRDPEEGGVQVALGVRDGDDVEFSDEPIEPTVGRSRSPWVADLDGDGRDELVFEPFGGDEEENRRVYVVGAP